MDKNVNTEHLKRAQKRVECLKGFYVHLASYITVNLSLFIVWISGIYRPPYEFWNTTFLMTGIVAGFGVLANAIILFGAKYVLPKGWEEKKFRKLMDKQNKSDDRGPKYD
ncbi:2TM domain-containing protein [Flavobacterium hauense]